MQLYLLIRMGNGTLEVECKAPPPGKISEFLSIILIWFLPMVVEATWPL